MARSKAEVAACSALSVCGPRQWSGKRVGSERMAISLIDKDP